jgi:Predicted metal-dependent hydrolase of the TIM-barrel fold
MIKRVSQLGRSMFNDYEGNYGLIQDKFGRAFPGEAEPELFPLMMDIYYMFDGLFEDGSSAKAEGWSEETDALLSSWLSETRGAVRGIAEERARKPSPHQGMLQAELEKIEGKFDELETARATGAEWPDSVAMTPGYESEIRQSIELWKRHPGKVYPFLAVDPRRDGVMELVAGGGCFGIEGPLVSRAGPFYGVKLYPRLGYKPAEVEAIGLLEWCARGGIPITYHCNETGFPPWPGEWKWSGNGDPRLWEPYLKKYRGVNGGLRIDFAHFGDARPEWRRAIASYASNSLWRYGRNAYTDIACFVHPESLKRAKAAYDRRLRSVRGKLIFGSDYDVMLLVSDLDLESYYEQYKEVFKDDKKHAYAEDMMNRAPRAFLNARPR